MGSTAPVRVLRVSNTTSRPGSAKGRAGNITARTMLKIAAFEPIPKASVSTAMAVKPGLRRSMRRP